LGLRGGDSARCLRRRLASRSWISTDKRRRSSPIWRVRSRAVICPTRSNNRSPSGAGRMAGPVGASTWYFPMGYSWIASRNSAAVKAGQRRWQLGQRCSAARGEGSSGVPRGSRANSARSGPGPGGRRQKRRGFCGRKRDISAVIGYPQAHCVSMRSTRTGVRSTGMWRSLARGLAQFHRGIYRRDAD